MLFKSPPEDSNIHLGLISLSVHVQDSPNQPISHSHIYLKKKKWAGTSLVVQRLRIHLAMKGTDKGSIPGQGTKIPYASEQLNPPAVTTQPARSGARVPQPESMHCSERSRVELVCLNQRVHALQ